LHSDDLSVPVQDDATWVQAQARAALAGSRLWFAKPTPDCPGGQRERPEL